MKNEDVNKAFLNGNSAKTKNLRSDGRTLYSYNTAIAMRMPNGEIVFNRTKYSVSTSKIQNNLFRQAKSSGHQISVTGNKPYNYNFGDLPDSDFTKDNDDKFKKHLRK